MLPFFNRETRKKEYKFDDYWIQKVPIKRIENRLAYFQELCKAKKVIHFGCTDYPIFNPDHNLHIQLNEITKELHGFDIDRDGIELLKQYVKQPYFSSFEEVGNNYYDVCLIPETIEHVDNVSSFLKNLKNIHAKLYIITGPNCFAKEHMERNNFHENVFEEIIHPDHNCWYSPFTLKNVIEKYSSLKVNSVNLLEQDRMVCCEASIDDSKNI
jgi:hypothetical protein